MKRTDARTGVSDRRQPQSPDAEFDVTPQARDIYLADDDAELRDTLRFALESSGHRVTTYDNGPAALEGLLALPSQRQHRLLLVSIDLPGLDGHTLHEQLQAARPRKFIVVFLSVRDSDADQVRAASAGAFDYLVKPVSIPILLAKLDVWFQRCGATA
ncbi:MAG: response regulator transcription factor [Gemmatimonadaceae bacterium]|nr:response regulator transcription factor [Gemmatimonadaceae bacterium]